MTRSKLLALTTLLFPALCTAQATYDARIVQYVGTTYACDGEVRPIMKIINNGTETMIGCVVETWKNGLLDNSFDWQLPIPAAQGQVRTPSFPAVEAAPGDMLEFRIISVNGIADQVEEGNVHQLEVRQTQYADAPLVRVEVTTDDAPTETSWVIRTADYTAVASGGPYTDADTYHEHWLELEPYTCYLFEVLDAAGNGINSGSCRITSAEQPVLELLPESFSLHSDGFETGGSAGLSEWNAGSAIGLFPNPSAGSIVLELPSTLQGQLAIIVRDISGRMVHSFNATAPNNALTLDLSSLSPGRYQIQALDDAGNMSVGAVILTDR